MSGLTASRQVTNSPQCQALSIYLSDPEREIDGTLDAFCQPIEDQFTSTSSTSDVESSLWTAWQGVVAIAASTSYSDPNRAKSANFLVRLLYRPNLVSGDQTCEIDGMVVWRDLPVLGWELREAWNFAASDSSDQSQKGQWVNLNAFTATLVAQLHSSAVDRPDYSLFCIWTIRTALEDSAQPSDVSVAAAAVWLTYASPAIWDFSQQSKSFDGKVAAPGALFKDQKWTGFSNARWDTWTQKLSDLKAATSTGNSAALIEQALGAMSSASGT